MGKTLQCRNGKRLLMLTAWFTSLLCIWPENAHAYFDPGTGSMILQAIIALLIGIGLAIKEIRVRIWSFFQRIRERLLGG